ncbi:MAG: SRPBCC family protein [Chitinophagaceae bacterium]|nr:SRPBCC family protein [Chitinophagaceae bacterium]
MSNISHTVNVGKTERVVSLLGGSLLLLDSLFNSRFRGFKVITAGYLMYRGISGNCPAYSIAGKDSWRQYTNANVRVSMRIERSPSSLYQLWRNFENLPRFMTHLISVKEVFENIYEWKADIPGKAIPVQWKACIVHDVPGETISWRSLPDSSIENAGKVEFRKIDSNTTDLRITISYKPPMGLIGGIAADFFHPKLEKIVLDDVNSFRLYAENQLNTVPSALSAGPAYQV